MTSPLSMSQRLPKLKPSELAWWTRLMQQVMTWPWTGEGSMLSKTSRLGLCV